MKQIFPKEFLEHTSEIHRFRHRKRSLIIYALLMFFIVGSITALPFLRIPLYISSRGKIIDMDSQEDYLIVECKIRPGEIGLIRKNTPLTYQIDAFDHNQWGMATGKILHVSQDADILHEQVVFRILCSIDEKYLSLNQHRAYLRKEQTLTANIKLAERSLFQLLSDHWHNWLDPSFQN